MAVIVRGDKACFSTLALVGELVEEVLSCGKLSLHRDIVRQRTMVEVSVQVVRRAPLRRCRGLRPGGATTRQLPERIGGGHGQGRRGQLASNFLHSFQKGNKDFAF